MGDDTDAPPGMRWLAAGLAAEALGVSERTLRRYVALGRYRARRDGGRAFVLVPAAGNPAAPAASIAALPAAALASALLALEGLGRRVAALEARVDALADAGRRLERLEWVAQRLIHRVEALQRGRASGGAGAPPQPEPDEPRAGAREPEGGRPGPRDMQSSVPAL